MRLCIADPPYLGRADRWYGDGRGSGRTRVATAKGRNGRKPDHHPDAREWDKPERHQQLIRDLGAWDGWALAGAPDYLSALLEVAPRDVRVGVWHRPNAMPGAGRVITTWEPVLYLIPPGRRARTTGPMMRDLLTAPVRKQGFLGSKPPEWTAWVLQLLGYDSAQDTVDDIFHGSGAVAAASAQGVLSLSGEDTA